MLPEQIFNEVNQRASNAQAVLIDRFLDRIVNPPISAPTGSCIKHFVVRPKYVNLCILKTKYMRGSFNTRTDWSSFSPNSDDEILIRWRMAKEEYKNTPCTCHSDLPSKLSSPSSVCSECRENYSTMNSCRQPIHLAFKKNEVQWKPNQLIAHNI